MGRICRSYWALCRFITWPGNKTSGSSADACFILINLEARAVEQGFGGLLAGAPRAVPSSPSACGFLDFPVAIVCPSGEDSLGVPSSSPSLPPVLPAKVALIDQHLR